MRIWTDEAKGYGYTLDSSVPVDLITIAKSIGIWPGLVSDGAQETAKALEQFGNYNILTPPSGMETADPYLHCNKRLTACHK